MGTGLIRIDSAGGTHDFVAWLARRGRWLSYSVGMVITEQVHQHVSKVPASAWTPAVETDGEIRDGAWVAELTGDVLTGWPTGMRLIVKKKRPHPKAQLRLTDADGMRLTCFATNTSGRPIAELEHHHRLRARTEDRIRNARATGLRNLPLHRTPQNRIWLENVQIALDLLAWMPMLALTGKTRLWEPPPALVHRSRTVRDHRPSADPPPGPALALGPATSPPHSTGSHSCRTPADQQPSRPYNSSPEQCNPAPPRDDTRALNLPTLSPRHENGPPTPSADRHETSRLASGFHEAGCPMLDRNAKSAPDLQRWDLSRVLSSQGKKHSSGEEAYRVVPACPRRGRRSAGWSRRPGGAAGRRPSARPAWTTAISAALAPWRKPRAVHDPGKILLDVALAVALGGDCLADVGVLRAEPAVFGPVASDPTVSRLVDTLAASGPRALTAIRSARAEVRERVWKLARTHPRTPTGQVIVDIDGVLVLAHSEKQDATATWKKTFGHHPLVAFVDHGSGGSGEPVAALLRPGNAGIQHRRRPHHHHATRPGPTPQEVPAGAAAH